LKRRHVGKVAKGLVYGNSTVFHFANTSEAQGGFGPGFHQLGSVFDNKKYRFFF